ncbi:MAG TPA: D-alanyl-D-alanine carboxypeptidase family protein [Solirubrobacterales bacterium]|nr:D-alanyl-D-alanine carboxypeptidase family protein [Solirubrobacterales bacterium]
MRLRLLVAALCAALLAPLAAASEAGAAEPALDARAWALIDARTGDVLASHAADERLPIASTTKLMTAYVALKELSLRETVRAASYTPTTAESLLGLRPGQPISVRDLLYGLILQSGNDAAYDLALAAAGSEDRFVREMNRYAAALGLSDTHYANPIGLDEAGNYSTAYDLAALARRLLAIPAFAKIAASRQAVLRSLRPPRRIDTRVDLLYELPWATGIKTGYTLGAGYVLVGAGRLDGVQLVSAVLGTESEAARDEETEELLTYGFSLHRHEVPVRGREAMAAPPIRWTDGRLSLRAARTVAIGVRREQRLAVEVDAPSEVEGPIRKGAVLGRATVSLDGVRVARVPLLAARSVPEASTVDKARDLVGDNLSWLALIVFAILIAVVLLRRRRR